MSEEKQRPYRPISVKKELVDDIENWIKQHPEAGYSTVADFASESVRLRIQRLREKYPEHP